MNDLKQLAFNAVTHISAGKALQKNEPTTALLSEVVKMLGQYDAEDVKKALRTLVRSKKIECGRTINDIYFKTATNGNGQ